MDIDPERTIPGHLLNNYAAESVIRYEPDQWRSSPGGRRDPGGHQHRPSFVEMFEREYDNNAHFHISDVSTSCSTVSWYWQCERGHRFRASMTMMYARSQRPHRWQHVAGSLGACRHCVIEDHGLIHLRCGHRDTDLSVVGKPARDDLCIPCRVMGAARPGQAYRSTYQPPVSKDESTLRRRLGECGLDVAPPYEANAVRVCSTPWGARSVFPDLLIPSYRIAIEYDSPGSDGHAHGSERTDLDQDHALAEVGWSVIRVRTGGLLPLHNDDVVATGPTYQAVRDVMGSVQRLLR